MGSFCVSCCFLVFVFMTGSRRSSLLHSFNPLKTVHSFVKHEKLVGCLTEIKLEKVDDVSVLVAKAALCSFIQLRGLIFTILIR